MTSFLDVAVLTPPNAATLNTIPHVVVTPPTIKLFSTILSNYNFAMQITAFSDSLRQPL